MTAVICQDDTFVSFADTQNTGFWISNDQIAFTSWYSEADIARAADCTVYVTGQRSFTYVGESADDVIHDQGSHNSFLLSGDGLTLDVGTDFDATLRTFGSAAAIAPDGHGGLAVTLSGGPVGGTIDVVGAAAASLKVTT